MICYKKNGIEIIYREGARIKYDYHVHRSSVVVVGVIDGELTVDNAGEGITISANEMVAILPFELHKLQSRVDCSLFMLSIPVVFFIKDDVFPLVCDLANLLSTDICNRIIKDKVLAFIANLRLDKDYLKMINQKNEYIALFENAKTLEEMAEISNYSKYYFLRKFKKFVGIPPHRFKQLQMIRKAQEMMWSGQRSIEIIKFLNYYDQSHFIKSFKEVVGITPTEYAQAIEGGNKLYKQE